MNLTTLRALQSRVRECKGADRELDCIIQAVFDGRTIREENNMIFARSSRPPHDECLLGTIDPGRHQRNFTEAYRNPKVPYFTTDPDGLGACVSLLNAVLPGWTRVVDASAPELGIAVELLPPDDAPPALQAAKIKGDHDLETHAHLEAIFSAAIAQLEAQLNKENTHEIDHPSL